MLYFYVQNFIFDLNLPKWLPISRMKPCVYLHLEKVCSLVFVAYSIIIYLINLVYHGSSMNQSTVTFKRDTLLKTFLDVQDLQHEIGIIHSKPREIHRMQKVVILAFKRFIVNSLNLDILIDRFVKQKNTISIIRGADISNTNIIQFLTWNFSAIIDDCRMLVTLLKHLQLVCLIKERILKR